MTLTSLRNAKKSTRKSAMVALDAKKSRKTNATKSKSNNAKTFQRKSAKRFQNKNAKQ